jgi:aspartate racemase
MISACQKLASYPVDFITIPCNSASYYIKDITPHCDTEIINIIEVASKSIRNHSPTAKSALVLGGRTTYAKKSYQPFLQAEGISYIDLDEEDQMIVETIIEHIKLRPDARDIPDKLSKMMKHIRDRYQPDVIILGCTEFGCLTSSSVPETLIIDSSDELANYIIDIARKK